jgi:hypothetical protein
MQLPKDFESITLPDGTTQTLGPTRVTRLLFSRTSLCWVTESVRNSYNLSTPTGRCHQADRERTYEQLPTLP